MRFCSLPLRAKAPTWQVALAAEQRTRLTFPCDHVLQAGLRHPFANRNINYTSTLLFFLTTRLHWLAASSARSLSLADPATPLPFPRSCRPWLVASTRQGLQSTLHPAPVDPIQLHPTVRLLLLLLRRYGRGHTVLGTFPAPKPVACGEFRASGEHTQARNHHSTKRGHFCHAAIMACMHAWINPGNILASQPRAELMVHTTPAIDSSAQVLN